MLTCIVFFWMLTDQGLRFCCEALFWEIYIAPFPMQKVYGFEECFTGCGILRHCSLWDFKVFLGCCQGFAFRKCHDEGLRKCLFFFLWKINHLGEASIFCVFLGGESWNFLMGMSSLQRRVQLKTSLETPISSHFWFPKRCLNRIDCPLMKLGLVPQSFFLLQTDSSGGAATSLKGFVSV